MTLAMTLVWLSLWLWLSLCFDYHFGFDELSKVSHKEKIIGNSKKIQVLN
jgi:hypothetical protein